MQKCNAYSGATFTSSVDSQQCQASRLKRATEVKILVSYSSNLFGETNDIKLIEKIATS